MNCKPCIRLEGEISSMSVGNGYSGGRLASSTHCTCKPRMKALRSFKALVLKTPVEVGQEDVDTSVSPDDSKQSKEKLTFLLQKMIYRSGSSHI